MKLKQTMLLILIFIIILISVQCNTTEPPPNKATLTLTLEYVSCTEAWLQLKLSNMSLPSLVTLYKNGAVAQNNILCYGDTLLYVDSLLPKQTYTYQASGIGNPVSSNAVTVTTLDTTSHNFSWQTFTFGEHSSSVLYDVAIINENNIWTVGEIYMKDSLGNNDPHAYNAVHWDGSEWKLYRIMFYTICGQTSLSSYPAKAIFAFGENDIWIAGGGRQLARINGTNQVDKICLPFSMVINKLWGSSSNDLYAVGNGGNIAHYQNGVWTKIESGTTADIQDIWGIQYDNETLILSAVSNPIEPGDRKILRIKTSNFIDTIGWMSDRRVHSVWMESKFQLFACGDGMFINSHFNLWKKQEELTFVFTERIRGNSGNDLFVVGDFGIIAHYNGVGWKEYPEASAALVYTSLDMRNNLMITVGYTQRRAVIQKMIRN